MKNLLSLLFCLSLVSCTTPVEEPTEEPIGQPIFEDFSIALVAMSDGEAKPEPSIGCGDAIQLVTQESESTGYVERVQTALEALFSIKDSNYGESGLYNALYQSDLKVDQIIGMDTEMIVMLTGSIVSGGVCDDPRIEEQIMQTIEANVSEDINFSVSIDGKDLHEYFDLSGQ